MKRISLFVVLLCDVLTRTSGYAQTGYVLKPTHKLTAAVEDDTQFSTGTWSPSAPITGGAGTVLHLDIDILTTANNSRPEIGNDFAPTAYELTGLLLDVNDRSNAFNPELSRPAASSWRFVADGELNPRLELFNLGGWDLQAPMELADDLTIFQPRVPNKLDLLGPITGSGGLIVDGTDLQNRVNLIAATNLLAPASYTGPTVVRSNGITIGEGGSLAATSSITVEHGGLLGVTVFNTVGPTLDRIDDAIPITLAGGTFYGQINDMTDVETLGNVTLAQATASQITARTANGEIAISNLTRQRHAMLSVYGDSDIRGVGGEVSKGRIKINNAPTLVGGGGASGTTNISIVPYMAGNSNQSGAALVAVTNSLVTLDSNNNLRVLDRTTEFASSITVGTNTSENVRIIGQSPNFASPTTVNALLIEGARKFYGESTLTVTSGVISSHPSNSNSTVVDSTILAHKETILPNNGYLWAKNTMHFYSDLTVTGDLNKAGLGIVEIIGQANVSAGTALAEGMTRVLGTLNSTEHVIVSAGAELELLPGGTITTPLLDFSAEEASFRMTGGTLQADTVLGDLVIEGGVFTPIPLAAASVAGDLNLLGGEMEVELGGESAGDFSQFNIAGDMFLLGGLDVDLANGYRPRDRDEFLISRIGGLREGQFTGLAEGDVAASFGSVDLHISYSAGDGNDIALIAAVIPEPTTLLLSAMATVFLMARKRNKRTSLIVSAVVLSTLGLPTNSRAAEGYLLNPTHVVTPSADGNSLFSTSPWSPSAPTTGGGGTVLHLDVEPRTNTSVAKSLVNDFAPTVYELSGLLLDANDDTSIRLPQLHRPAGSSWRFVNGSGTDPRIEVTGLGGWEFFDPIEAGDDLTLYSPVNYATNYFYDDLSGPGGLTFVGRPWLGRLDGSEAFQFYQGIVSHTGPTIVRGRGLHISAGSFTATSSITIESGMLDLTTNFTGENDLVADTIPIVLAGGAIARINSDATSTEVIGSVTLSKASTNHVVVRGADGALQFDNFVRERHAALAIYGDAPIRGVGGVVSGGERIILDTPPATIGGGGVAGTTNISIVPFIAGHSSQSGVIDEIAPENLVTVDPNKSLRVLDRNTELQSNLTPGTLSDTNVRQTSNVTLTAPTSVNALVLESSAQITGPSSISITSGMLLASSANNSSSQFGVADLLFPNDAQVWLPSRMEIFSNVTVTGDLSKSGLGLLELFGPTNVGGGAAFTEGKTDLYGDLDAAEHVIVGSRGELELFAGASICTSLFEITGDAANFTMFGGMLETEAVLGDLRIDGGTFAPSGSPSTDVDGNLYLLGESELAIDINGTAAGQFDQLDISGDLLLGADLNVALGYIPTPGDEILFGLVDGVLAGQFAGLGEDAVAAAVGNVDLRISYTAGDGNDISLLAVLQGDFDRDNDVDGFDFLKWQRGESPNPLSQADLAAWQTNYGTVAPPLAGSTAIPEPGACVLLIAFLVPLVSMRQQN